MQQDMKLDTLDPQGQGSLELPLHVPSYSYLGLSFHSLIKPFPFLVDRAVQNPGQEATAEGSVHRRTTHGLLIKDFKGLKVYFLLVTLCLYDSTVRLSWYFSWYLNALPPADC